MGFCAKEDGEWPCKDATTATPACAQAATAACSRASPSSSNTTTCGAKHRTACKMPLAFGYPRSTSHPSSPSTPLSSPRSSTTATRTRRAANEVAISRNKLVLPLDGSPTISVLCTPSAAYSSGSNVAAQPVCARGKRTHSEVICRTPQTHSPSSTAVPAIPTRIPPATAIYPCRSSSSCAYTDCSQNRKKHPSNISWRQTTAFGCCKDAILVEKRNRSPCGVDSVTG